MLGKEKKLKRQFKNGLGAVAYHAACHLRAQKIGFPGMRVLSIVPEHRGADDRGVLRRRRDVGDEGGAHYEVGRRYAGKLVRGVEAAEPDVVVSDCSLSALRIGKENKLSPLHPIEAVAWAYGLVDALHHEGGEKEATWKPIDRSEILPLGEYEAIRPHFRARVIEEKKARRVAVAEAPLRRLREPRHGAPPDPRDAPDRGHHRRGGDRPRDRGPTTSCSRAPAR